MRKVPDRLARDFWVRPSEKMIRLWCRSFADELDFATDYQPWGVANFSGALGVDGVYQYELALLLAVDPASIVGDRLVGYSLVSEGVDHEKIRTFLLQRRAAGIAPAEVITDDSRMYPTVLAEIWPSAAHQLCLFHATRNVVKAVNEVVKKVRRTIPVPPPATPVSLKGSLRHRPPRPDEHDADAERYRLAPGASGSRHRQDSRTAASYPIHSRARSGSRGQSRHCPPLAQADSTCFGSHRRVGGGSQTDATH